MATITHSRQDKSGNCNVKTMKRFLTVTLNIFLFQMLTVAKHNGKR